MCEEINWGHGSRPINPDKLFVLIRVNLCKSAAPNLFTPSDARGTKSLRAALNLGSCSEDLMKNGVRGWVTIESPRSEVRGPKSRVSERVRSGEKRQARRPRCGKDRRSTPRVTHCPASVIGRIDHRGEGMTPRWTNTHFRSRQVAHTPPLRLSAESSYRVRERRATGHYASTIAPVFSHFPASVIGRIEHQNDANSIR